MSNTNSRKPASRRTSAAATQQSVSSDSESSAQKSIIPKDVDASQYVTVRNGFQGKLIYKSKKTGEMFEWDSFGSEQEMELRELRNAKSSSKNFFINNWFMFDEDWIIDYLGVNQYYKNAISIDNFDDIFTLKPDEMRKTVGGLSEGQKRSVAYRAKELISEQKIDSLSVISTLEDVLHVELIEH